MECPASSSKEQTQEFLQWLLQEEIRICRNCRGLGSSNTSEVVCRATLVKMHPSSCVSLVWELYVVKSRPEQEVCETGGHQSKRCVKQEGINKVLLVVSTQKQDEKLAKQHLL